MNQEPLFITESKKKCIELGMDPGRLPSFSNVLSHEQLLGKRSEYEEILTVVRYFVNKTLDLMKGFPILIVVTDENASILEMAGDSTIKNTINAIGIKDGLQFEDNVTGTNSITLALQHRHVVQLVGANHFHQFLHTSACYSVPFQYTDVKQLLGTISIMTAVELHHPTLQTMLCTVADSIERELLLRKQNRRLHILNQIMIESTRNGIIVTDKEGTVTEFNEFAQKLTGLKKEDVLRKSVRTIQPAGDYLCSLLQNGNKFEDVQMIFEQTHELRRKICLFDALPIYDENSVLVGAFGQFRDITDSFEAKEEAEKASNAKSQFLSSMSHELRTPLNAILGFAQLLEFETAETQLDDVQEIIKAGNHLLELINEILDLSRIENNKMQVTLSTVDVDSLMEECLSLIQPLSEAKKIGLYWKPFAANVQVSADRIRLKQALINLLTNAIKYNIDEGSVTVIGGIPDNNRYRLSVVDTGYGMEESEIPFIFQPFHRLPKHNAIEGTGIGLTITKQLIELMGGSIGVKSQPSKGSEFWIELNMIPDSELDGIDTPVSDLTGNKTSPEEKMFTILYVEDNQANLTLVTRILKGKANIRLLASPNALTGIEMARSYRPDLILMDINLPDISGFEAFSRLQALDTVKDIPVIAISANAMPTDIKRGMDLGFMNYLTKPINVPDFIKHINDALGTGEETLTIH